MHDVIKAAKDPVGAYTKGDSPVLSPARSSFTISFKVRVLGDNPSKNRFGWRDAYFTVNRSPDRPNEMRDLKLLKGMGTMKATLLRLWNEEEGQDLTEYALLLVLLTLAAIGSLSTLASAVNGVFASATTKLGT